MTAETLKAKIKVCVFDRYGTVVDMQKGLTEVVTPYLKDKGWAGRPDSFVTWWRRTHFENSMIDALLHKEHTPYREIGHRAVAYTLERAGIAFDAVISVAVANSFKPHVATYSRAAELMGVWMDEVLFVANHAFDCIGAKAAGMRTAFIDRRSRPFGMTPHQPDILVPDMKSLADMLV